MTEVSTSSDPEWNDLIDKLTFAQLNDVRAHISERMKHMRETGVEEMRLKFIEDAAALGLSPEDIFAPVKKQRRKRRKHKEGDGTDDTAA